MISVLLWDWWRLQMMGINQENPNHCFDFFCEIIRQRYYLPPCELRCRFLGFKPASIVGFVTTWDGINVGSSAYQSIRETLQPYVLQFDTSTLGLIHCLTRPQKYTIGVLTDPQTRLTFFASATVPAYLNAIPIQKSHTRGSL